MSVARELSSEPEQVRQAWDAIAAGYDEFVTPTHMWLASEALGRVGLTAGMRFLDVAAGSGALSVPAARLGARVLATDLSPAMVGRLELRARREGLADLEVRVMDGHDLQLEDDTFDVSGSLAFFMGAMQSAVPGFGGLPMDPPPLAFQAADPEALRAALAGAGLADVRIETVTESLEFETGPQMWDWVTNSNPIGAMLVADLSDEQGVAVREGLDAMLRQRSGGGGPALLTNPIHIGVGSAP